MKTRTATPFQSLPFIIYVVTAVFMFGGLGIWAEILKIAIGGCIIEWSGLVTSVLTFFPALIGSTTLQLILASSNQGSTDKIMISFALLLLCVFLAFAVLLPFVSTNHPIAALIGGSFCALAAVWVWWITNGHDPMFSSQLPDAATGGSSDRDLPGDETGFRVDS